MINREDISISVIKRLPRYHRFLGNLIEIGIDRISSRELSSKMGLTASLIRQDLNCFGGFGQQGYGYNVKLLYEEIGGILGIHSTLKAIIIGAGNLGRVIATHMDFEQHGFQLIGIFDKKESMAGQLVRGLPLRQIDGLDEFCRENLPQVAILCIPTEAVEELSDQLVALGIKGFWNFTHYDVAFRHPNTSVENVHLSDSLMTFCYKMNNNNKI